MQFLYLIFSILNITTLDHTCTTSLTKPYIFGFFAEILRKPISDRSSNLLRNSVSHINKNIQITNINHVERKPKRPVSVARLQQHRTKHDHRIVVQSNTVALWTIVAERNCLRVHHQHKKSTKNLMPKKCPPTITRTDYITAS